MSCQDNFADANRTRLAYIKEIVFCEFPQPAEMQIARITSSDFAVTKETSPSDEIRSDRQVSDLAELSLTTGGTLAFEKSLTTFDELLEGALCNDWVIGLHLSADFTLVNDDPAVGQTSINDVLAGAVFANVSLGDQLYITDGTASGWFRVVVLTNDDTISVADPNNDLTAGVGVELTIDYDTLINGVEKISYSIEQAFLDVEFYQLFHGQRVGTWDLEIESQAKITGSFAFQGTELETAGTEYGTSYLPATTTPIINSTSNVGTILVDGNVLETCIQSISLNLDNALRVQPGVGSKYPCGIGLGRQVITGDLTAYFVDATLYNIFLNHTDAAILIPLQDTEGNHLLIEMPKIKFSTDSPAPSAIDTDILDEISYQAIFDAEAGFTIRLSRASDTI